MKKIYIQITFISLAYVGIWTANINAQVPRAVEPNNAKASALQEAKEVRERFVELSQKVNEDPKLKGLKTKLDEAQTAYASAFEEAMKKEDAKLWDEYQKWRESLQQRMGPEHQGEVKPLPPKYAKLSEEQKKQLSKARQQASQTPAVRDARSKRNQAKTEAERKAAESEYRTALQTAMIQSNPNLKELVGEVYGSKPE